MRVLITNSLVLAAISLAPAVSAAPYTTSSSVDSYESYPNSTAFAQSSGTSSVPSMLYPYGRTIHLSHHVPRLDARRDEIIHVESLYDSSPFGHFFGPVADLFRTMGMETISDTAPPTEAQKAVLDKLHEALSDAVSKLPVKPPVSPPVPRSLEDVRLVNPPAPISSLSILGGPVDRILEIFSSVGIGADPPVHPTEAQKVVLDKLHEALADAVSKLPVEPPVPRSLEDVRLVSPPAPIDSLSLLGGPVDRILEIFSSVGIGANPPVHPTDVQEQVLEKLRTVLGTAMEAVDVPKPGVLPLNHARSVEERSLQDIVSNMNKDTLLSSVFAPVIGALSSLGVTNGNPVTDVQNQALSKLQAAIATVVQKIKDNDVVHIEHSREEHEHWHDHDHHHEPHRDDRHSHDEHKHDGEHWEDGKESREAQKDGGKPHDAHKDGHKSPDMHAEDRHAHGPGRDGDHCHQPRDGQWDECRHHHDGSDRNEGSSLLKLSLGNSHHG